MSQVERQFEILLALLNRAPMSEAEVIGANVCAAAVKKALADLAASQAPAPKQE